MNKTRIEWTDDIWNPVTGCTPVSEGCRHCYAKSMAIRNRGRFGYPKEKPFAVTLRPERLHEPYHIRKPSDIFVCSMGDLFHKCVPYPYIHSVFDRIWGTPRHTYRILTKRADRMARFVRKTARAWRMGDELSPEMIIHFEDLRSRCGWHIDVETEYRDIQYGCRHPNNENVLETDSCDEYRCPIAGVMFDRDGYEEIGIADEYTFDENGEMTDECEMENELLWMRVIGHPRHAWSRNAWLGISAENQERFDERTAEFSDIRLHAGRDSVLFASCEPLLGPIELRGAELDWIIAGGETGSKARPMNLDWARALRDQCREAGVPFFYKGAGTATMRKKDPEYLLLDGRVHHEMPNTQET
uniref:Phage protein Gp37/Gp68 n=1 Tax=Candidatus Kentrum sp. LPFa TaxID=2126335 RepID=A0A450WDC7_9GAMM|nr:MAG: Phage protein Gp37/Gp68 [Candidatus Kentron sp. LPFa]